MKRILIPIVRPDFRKNTDPAFRTPGSVATALAAGPVIDPAVGMLSFEGHVFWTVVLISVVLGLVACLILYRFVRYDGQIRQLLRTQKTFDLCWVDLNAGNVISKSNFSLFRKWGLVLSGPTVSIDEISRVLGRDTRREYVETLEKMKRSGARLIVEDKQIPFRIDGRNVFYRRYLHLLGNNRFMACFQDITTLAEVEAQERLLANLFDALRDGLLYIDHDLKVRRYNKAVLDLFPECDPNGESYRDFFNRTGLLCSDSPTLRDLMRCQAGRQVEYLERPRRWIEYSCFPVTGADSDQVTGVLEFLRDITEQHHREESLRTMKLIIDNISEPVFWLFLDGTIQYANAAAGRAWGLDPKAAYPEGPIGGKVWVYDDAITPENWQHFAGQVEMSKTSRFDTAMKRKDGGSFPVVVTVDLVKQNETLFFAACFHDMTDATRRIEAEQSALAKTRFLDHMSHEIRTPLNGVVGMADILLETPLDDKQRRFVETIKFSGDQLIRLVNDILDFSRFESGEFQTEVVEFDLPDLVRGLLGEVEDAAREQSLELTGELLEEMPARMIGDAKHLRQALFPLLENALKFTHRGEVRLSVSVKRHLENQDENRLVTTFSVKDTGVGISPESQGRLFESFSLGDTSFARQYGGCGLGLSISRRLVEQMGGQFGFRSEERIGSTFWIDIPLQPTGSVRVPPGTIWHIPGAKPEEKPTSEDRNDSGLEQAATDSTGRLPILVVEDNRINRIVMGELLKQAGLPFEFAENGLIACQAISEKAFSLVLMDCQMPVMDGFQASRKIREMEAGRDELRPAHTGRIPIVAVTANAMSGDEQRCYDAGMDGFCAKPVSGPKLLESIEKWIPETPK